MDMCVVDTQTPIGIFGGTFDPIHYGHLRLAEELAESLHLAQVRFIPVGRPPHRSIPHTDALHRLRMVQLAIVDNARFVADAREIEQEELSYTVNTLQTLRQQFGASRPLYLLLGADAFLGVPRWHRWQELLNLAHIAVAYRPGFPYAQWKGAMPTELRLQFEQRLATQSDIACTPVGCIIAQPITALDISATYIRDSLQTGHTPRYLLPDVVLDYIHTHHLYYPEPA